MAAREGCTQGARQSWEGAVSPLAAPLTGGGPIQRGSRWGGTHLCTPTSSAGTLRLPSPCDSDASHPAAWAGTSQFPSPCNPGLADSGDRPAGVGQFLETCRLAQGQAFHSSSTTCSLRLLHPRPPATRPLHPTPGQLPRDSPVPRAHWDFSTTGPALPCLSPTTPHHPCSASVLWPLADLGASPRCPRWPPLEGTVGNKLSSPVVGAPCSAGLNKTALDSSRPHLRR